MNIETVNELIQSLESAGELSIKERKYLELAKAYVQLAAENVAPRQRIAELESRTVKLPEAFYPDGDIDCPLVVNLDDAKEMLTTTGINWEAE